ncbi:PspC domain-containing protein [Nocardiopsis sp. FIRDI 009]|uniref:PspC domain-containing protein n=1 Tax=Nocardiopsis sp. FIRDI 009 TaxID=714197 RepID=UPI000E28353B|nr:PspC domain-containing protein [Nocardiopsis sp. FIRDI 009]
MTDGPAAEAATLEPERELRKGEDRVLAGVCTGLGRYTDTDPIVWRTAFALTAFAGATGLLLYVGAWMLMRDDRGGPATFEQMLDRSIPSRTVVKLLAVGLATATALSLVGGFGWTTLVLTVPLVLGLLAARNRGVDLRASFLGLRDELRRRRPPPTTPAPEPAPSYFNPAQPWASAPQGPVDLAVVAERTAGTGDGPRVPGADGGGAAPPGSGAPESGERPCGGESRRGGVRLASLALWTILGLAVAVSVVARGWDSSLWSRETAELVFGPETGVFFLAGALAIVGVYALVGTWAGRTGGLTALGLVLALAATAALSTDLTRLRVGETVWRPETVAEAESGDYRLTAGMATLDLTGLADLGPGDTLDLSVRVNGVTTLLLPEEAHVEVDSHLGVGLVDLGGGRDRSGTPLDHREVLPPVAADGSGGNGEDAPPSISVDTDGLVGVVEVRHGEA